MSSQEVTQVLWNPNIHCPAHSFRLLVPTWGRFQVLPSGSCAAKGESNKKHPCQSFYIFRQEAHLLHF